MPRCPPRTPGIGIGCRSSRPLSFGSGSGCSCSCLCGLRSAALSRYQSRPSSGLPCVFPFPIPAPFIHLSIQFIQSIKPVCQFPIPSTTFLPIHPIAHSIVPFDTTTQSCQSAPSLAAHHAVEPAPPPVAAVDRLPLSAVRVPQLDDPLVYRPRFFLPAAERPQRWTRNGRTTSLPRRCRRASSRRAVKQRVSRTVLRGRRMSSPTPRVSPVTCSPPPFPSHATSNTPRAAVSNISPIDLP